MRWLDIFEISLSLRETKPMPKDVKSKQPETIQQMQVDPKLNGTDKEEFRLHEGARETQPVVPRRKSLVELEEENLAELLKAIDAAGRELLVLYAEAAQIKSRIDWVKTTPGAEAVLQQIIDREVARRNSAISDEQQQQVKDRVKAMMDELTADAPDEKTRAASA